MTPADADARATTKVGRKRDHARDGPILDAAIAVLATAGYEGMTIDMVAAQVGVGRATVYRRWASKAELVMAAAARLGNTDAGLEQIPDTGSYRGDVIAAFVPNTNQDQQIRLQALTALLLIARAEPRIAQAATLAGIEPWIDLNRILIQRAIDRSEFPPGDVDALAQVIPMLCLSRALQQKPITAEFSLKLLDSVVIPALRGGS